MPSAIIPIEVVVAVPDIADKLLLYDQIQIHRSTTVETGVYTEITTPSTRPDLQALVTEYTYVDQEGSVAYFYKFRFYNSVTLAVSAFSAPEPGKQDPALDIISVEELKQNFLFGVDLTKDDGTTYPDSVLVFYIKAAVDWVSKRLDLPLIPVSLIERQDYFREEGRTFWFQLDRTPMISIEEVALVLPGSTPQIVSKDWIQFDRLTGQVELIPGGPTWGSLGGSIFGAFGAFGGAFGSRRIPQLIQVKYSAGFGPPPPGSYGFAPGSEPASVSIPDPLLDDFPNEIREIVGKVASYGPLNIAGDLVGGAGLMGSSLSIDGLSQSITTTNSSTNAGFGARLLQYQKEVKAQLPVLTRFYKGSRLRVA